MKVDKYNPGKNGTITRNSSKTEPKAIDQTLRATLQPCQAPTVKVESLPARQQTRPAAEPTAATSVLNPMRTLREVRPRQYKP